MSQRKSAAKMTAQEQQDYIDGVNAMIADNSYAALVAIHADMSHNMHSMGTLVSTLRFLSWHRAYLLHMEALLVAKKKNAFIPWWDWTQAGIPSWMVSFKPTVNGVANNRNNFAIAVSDQARLDVLTKTLTDYTDFTRALEVDPHNKGHVMLGFPMSRVPVAPSDPIFWMHHGEVDRIWSIWQTNNPGKNPVLTGSDAIMDPWTDTVSGLASISTLGYSYA
jgi:tyrosinase